MKIMKILLISLLSLTAAHADILLYDAQFNDTAGTVLGDVATTGTSFNSGVDAYGATDGVGNMVWSNMTPEATAFAAYEGGLTFTTNSTEIISQVGRISDFDFNAETTFGAGLRLQMHDGSKNAYMKLHVGGSGNQIQVRTAGYNESEVNHGAIFINANLSMSQAGWTSLELRMDADVGANTYDAFWRHSDGAWTQVAFDLPLGLGAGDGQFVEIDRVRLGANDAFQAGSTVAIDAFTVTAVPEPSVAVLFLAGLGLLIHCRRN